MHGSVLQNKDYIKFAEQSCVDVLALQDLDKGIAAGDPRAGTYKAKNERGEEVEYLLSWPGLTIEQVKALHASKAGTYNDTRGIPFTGIIDPHTESRMAAISGARPAGAVIDAVTEAKKTLARNYGEGISRKAYRDLREKQAAIRADLEKGDVVKAMATQRALEGKFTKAAEPVQKLLGATRSEALEAAGKKLEEAEAMLSAGNAKEAAALLGRLAPALRGTDLEARHAELLAKAKPS